MNFDYSLNNGKDQLKNGLNFLVRAIVFSVIAGCCSIIIASLAGSLASVNNPNNEQANISTQQGILGACIGVFAVASLTCIIVAAVYYIKAIRRIIFGCTVYHAERVATSISNQKHK